MNKEQIEYFLSNKSVFDLDRSKGAECVKFIPRRISDYQDNIKNYANQISILEDKCDDKLAMLRKLETQKGLRYLFKRNEIKNKKAVLEEEISQLERKIKNLKARIDNFNGLCEEENNKLRALQKEISDAGLTLGMIAFEYEKLHLILEKRERDGLAESEKKEKQKEQNQKGYKNQSAIDRFNSRMKKHNQILKQGQPGEN